MSPDAFLDIRLRDLHFFERLAALGSLTKVAAELRVPRATASRWLVELERRSGVALARRTTRVLALTPGGQELASRARVLLAQVDAARESLSSRLPTGVLRVSVPVPLGRTIAGPVIARFLKRLPRVRLEVVLENRRVDLIKDGIDVAIRGGELADSGLVARRLGSAALWSYASESYRGVERGRIPVVLAPGDEVWLRRAGVPRGEVAAIVDDRSAVAEAVIGGAGLGLLPAFLGGPASEEGSVFRQDDRPVVTLPIHAVYHPAARDDVRVRAFIDEVEGLLRARLQADAPLRGRRRPAP